MIKYAKVVDADTGLCIVGIGTNYEYYTKAGMEELDVDLSDIDNNWYLADMCPKKSEEEKEKEEQIRISKLECTKRVFVLMLEELGIDYFNTIQPLIESNRQAKLEWELCVRLERSNPLLDIMGEQLGVTPKQLDDLFRYANGEITLDDFKGLKDGE